MPKCHTDTILGILSHDTNREDLGKHGITLLEQVADDVWKMRLREVGQEIPDLVGYPVDYHPASRVDPETHKEYRVTARDTVTRAALVRRLLGTGCKVRRYSDILLVVELPEEVRNEVIPILDDALLVERVEPVMPAVLS